MTVATTKGIEMSNWPLNDDRSSANWTGRTQRSSDWGGNWAPNSQKIPPVAWLGALAVVAVFTLFSLAGELYYLGDDAPIAEGQPSKTMYATKE